jgi:hypothetical protein
MLSYGSDRETQRGERDRGQGSEYHQSDVINEARRL